MSDPEVVMIPCHCCGGLGKISLSGVYAETLELLKSRDGVEMNGAALARLAGCAGEAMCNRLVILESMGLVVGRRYGRQRLWKAVSIQKTGGANDRDMQR